MGHSVYNESAGWPHTKSYGQWLDVQVENSDEWCSLVVSIGLVLFNIFVSDMDSGIEWVESSPEEKDLGVLIDDKLNTTRKCTLAVQKAKCLLGCI